VAELKGKFGEHEVDAETNPGAAGIFDVYLGDELIYSKNKTGTFPRYREIPDLISQRRFES
jgi:selT/selW/selH-like putative selenoprotein